MRYIMKGGVWKNSQDEILKAAIMKYGLNQWSRISSLLQRKSAKQCKQRWYQWLDPSIKKTQWSRAEDQKLLHMARVFPSQWRTIAPFVGRTPTQCFQRYEKLLDLAQGKTNNQSEDLKKLRPGQIDPNPETKPARLDPIDMDEDEKQMLAEVRVRLANTKGKKAKRKQRQKIIEEARRLAQLQKIRQLEMAGVDNIPTAKEIKRMRQKKDIDYNKEIPFKRQIPEFTYKVENTQTPKNTFFASTISLQTLEGKRRDVEEELQRKLDKKRLKKLKDRDLKSVIQMKNDFDKPAAMPIQLPQPQLTEQDIENMRKYNITTPLNSQIIKNQTPLGMTPQNKIMLSARVNLSLNHAEVKEEVDGVEGLNYLRQMDKMEKDPTRKSTNRIMSQRVQTPSMNEWQQEKGHVKSLFKKLKKPEIQIEFEIPQEEEQEEEERQLDAEQAEMLHLQQQKLQQEERLSLRSSALKQNLPRPTIIPQFLEPSSKNDPAKLIQNELISMLYSDAIDYPQKPIELPKTQLSYITPLSREKIEQGIQAIDQQIKKSGQFSEEKERQKYLKQKSQLSLRNNKFVRKQVSEEEQEKMLMGLEMENHGIYRQYGKKVDQNEKKVKKYLGGYDKVIQRKIEEINNLEAQLKRKRMERSSLQTLRDYERVAMSERLSSLQAYYKLVYNSI